MATRRRLLQSLAAGALGLVLRPGELRRVAVALDVTG